MRKQTINGRKVISEWFIPFGLVKFAPIPTCCEYETSPAIWWETAARPRWDVGPHQSLCWDRRSPRRRISSSSVQSLVFPIKKLTKITLPWKSLFGKVWCLLWIDQSVQPPQVKWMRFVATISFLKHLEVNTSRTGTSADKEIWEWRDRYLLSCPFASPEFFLLFRRCPVPAERRLPPPNLLRLDLPSPFRQPSLLCS